VQKLASRSFRQRSGGMVQLRVTGEADNKLIERTRAALAKT